MSTKFDEYCDLKREQCPSWDDSQLTNADSMARALYGTPTRVMVETTYPNGETYRRTGSIGITTSWRPAFLVIHRSSDIGSSDVLGPLESPDGTETHIIAVQESDGRYYRRAGLHLTDERIMVRN